MAVLKLKNITGGTYGFNYRSPTSGKTVTKYVPNGETVELFTGSVDDCSAIRLQYTNLPDSDDYRLDECPLQFVWEGILPTLDDYRGSLLAGEALATEDANKELADTVTDTASGMTEESNLTVQRAGSRKGVTAHGTQG